jgi:GWxTD domain-containing protein
MYFAFIGKSLKYQKTDNIYKGNIELTIILKQDGHIKHFDKLNIEAPVLSDSTQKKDFLFVHRMFVSPGIYNLELILKDTLNKDKSGENRFYDIVQIFELEDKLQSSSIELIEKALPTEKENIFSKSGYDIYPYISDFFPASVNKIQAYIEFYNTLTVFNDEEFLVKYYINKVTSKMPYENYSATKRMKPSNIIPFIFGFDISQLPSGNYYLTVEVLNKVNQSLLIQNIFFQRSNPEIDKKLTSISNEELSISFINKYNNLDTLKDFIRCLFPISNQVELDKALSVLSSNNQTEMKRYILQFWKNKNPLNPEEEWNKYKILVDYVNKLYSTQVKKGYESDRGRVYLKYGAPNNVIESKHEPSAYPYEIWHYYVIGNQRDKRFVFYNPTLVANDYVLLHSDVRGEIYDKNWERRLSSRNNTMYNFDATDSDDQYGSRARENFRNK